MKLAILLLAGATCLMPIVAGAQNGPGCAGRCATQLAVCHSAAESFLEECLDRAETARAKALCAAEFTKLDDACREKEAACLSNCPSSD